MTDFLGRQAWKAHVALFVLVAAASVPASVQSACAASSWEGHPAHRAIWKIIDGKRKYQASAFAVGPHVVATVAHNLFDVVLKAGTDKLELVQAGRGGRIEIAAARAISTTHDLALLETATAMEHHLTVARTLPYGLADQFHAAGYPAGKFETVSVIAHTLHGDADYFDLPMDRIVPSGMSGSPVLAPNGEVIAMLRTSNDNVTGGVRPEFLNRLVEGDLGVSCGALGLTACLDKATAKTKKLAEEGNLAAQYQLGREHRYILGEPELRWLRHAADGGHASAQLELGNALFDGARGLTKDWKQSSSWLLRAAEQENSPAQVNISIAYSYGEGVPRDEAEALEWLYRALRNGDLGAAFNLGVMYYEGEGLPMDKKLGEYWLRRAAERGLESATSYLKEIRD